MAPPTQSSAPMVSKARVFGRRLISFTVLWGVILAALFSGNGAISQGIFLVIMCLLATAGLREFYAMARQRQLGSFSRWGMAGGVLLIAGTFLHATGRFGSHSTGGSVNDFEIGFLALFVLGLCLCQLWAKDNPHGLQTVATTLFGLLYVPWLLNFIQKIYFYPGINGTFYLLHFLLVTKFSDSGAYVVGSLCGRHKMIPRISPGKTWEGFAGAVLAATGGSVVFAALAGHRMAGMTLAHGLGLGILLSVGAVAGDLIESLFKREAGLKDSGRTFPGIGGILDLLDSLLFNAPLMYLYLRYVLELPAWGQAPSMPGL